MCYHNLLFFPVFRPYFLSPIFHRPEVCPQMKFMKWLEIPVETQILKLHEIIVPVLLFGANAGCCFSDTLEAIHNNH